MLVLCFLSAMNKNGSLMTNLSCNRESRWFLVAFVATVILSLVPFFRVGFTTSDDIQYFVTAQQSWQYWLMDHQVYAQHQGRFYFLITKFFYYIPYLADNFLLTKAIQYTTLLACYALFSYLVFRIMKSRLFAMMVMLVLVFNTCVTRMSYFIAVTSYPFYFTFSFLLFLCGVILFVSYYQSGHRHKWHPVWAGILFFVAALFYENYLVFIVLMSVYILLRHIRRDGFLHMWKQSSLYCEIIPLVVAVVVYVAIYVGYRHWTASSMPDLAFYGGAMLSGNNDFSWHKFFKVVNRCTFVTLPGQNYFQNKSMIADNSLSLRGFHNNPWYILTHSSPMIIINALLQAGLMLFLLRNIDARRWSWRRLTGIFVAAMIFAVSANILIALTPKYQGWSDWLRGYVTSFFSYFGIALALAVLVVMTLKLVDNRRFIGWIRGFWTFMIFLFAILISFANEHLSREWQRSQNRFVIIDEMAEQGFFDTLPDNALLYTEGLHHLSPTAYSICEGTNDIEDYINLRAGRKFIYAIDSTQLAEKTENHPESHCYSFYASENRKSTELLVAVTDSCGSTGFYLSPTKCFNVFYKVGDEWRQKNINAGKPYRKVTGFQIEDNGINPEAFFISNMIKCKE